MCVLEYLNSYRLEFRILLERVPMNRYFYFLIKMTPCAFPSILVLRATLIIYKINQKHLINLFFKLRYVFKNSQLHLNLKRRIFIIRKLTNS